VETETVHARIDGRVGRIVLDRPRALNALDPGMIRACAAALDSWRDDPAVHAVVIEGAGGRAFCAGGDIRAIRENALAGDAAAVEAFFAEEYALNLAVATYPKPYVALVDGICMGGGIGVSVHGAYRVATERALFAMPETAIGFFPDIGATYFLPRLPGALGMYMGLTGARIAGADAVHAGLATHFVPSERLSTLSETLARDGVASLAEAAAPLPAFTLAPHRAAIDRCFSGETVADILAALEREDTDWARETIATLRGHSPSSLLWSHAAIRRGATLTLPAALQAELALTRTVTRHPDFAEGVRAMVVDKDRTPRWSPPRLEDVPEEAIQRMFAA
jgi:enoyl-CoA hydratase/carnithine racemase